MVGWTRDIWEVIRALMQIGSDPRTWIIVLYMYVTLVHIVYGLQPYVHVCAVYCVIQRTPNDCLFS